MRKANKTHRQLKAALAREGYSFSDFRYNMIIGETADWEKSYLAVDLTGKTVLDIGAGEGETARFFLNHGASKVVAVEPEQFSYWILAKNAQGHNIVAVNEPFKAGMIWQFNPDFLKVDIEGYEECLLNVVPPCPSVVEVHGLQLRDKFAAKGWHIHHADNNSKLGFGCTSYAYWKCSPPD